MEGKRLVLRGAFLDPRPDGTVRFTADGALAGDGTGRLAYAGPWSGLAADPRWRGVRVSRCAGILVPPFLDCHTHIPQHPIRGRFTEGVPPGAPRGRLLAGLWRNVFPAEARCADSMYARRVTRRFLADTLAHGVVGGVAYMTVHAGAVRAALEILPATWSVGLVLMNRECPDALRTDEGNLERDTAELAGRFGRRLFLTDRFAVCVDSPLRRRAARLAARYGLRMQTHLDEQAGEKALVEQVLYPDAGSYTAVYRRDGLLEREPILAHCVHTRPEEWADLRAFPVSVAHCPVSNTLLGSGTMPLDALQDAALPYSLCTDVGASPTTSLLCEMLQFLRVHAGRRGRATPREALFRATLAAARVAGLDRDLGSFEPGKSFSCVEIRNPLPDLSGLTADEVILKALLNTDCGEIEAAAVSPALAALAAGAAGEAELGALRLEVDAAARRLDAAVRRVVLDGTVVWRRRVPGDARRPEKEERR